MVILFDVGTRIMFLVIKLFHPLAIYTEVQGLFVETNIFPIVFGLIEVGTYSLSQVPEQDSCREMRPLNGASFIIVLLKHIWDQVK